MRPSPASIALTGLILVVAGCSSRPPDAGDYLKQIAAARAAKDSQFTTGPDSPVPSDKRSEFLPLVYFPADPAYDVPASLEETPRGNRRVMPFETSRHEPRLMERIGVLKFSLQGRPLQVAAFVEQGESDTRLFVPFADATSGKETYRAGRYLDIVRTATGLYALDFNRAYNPYCYYNPTYDCPLPPRENRLPVEIRAGERVK